MVQNLKEPTVMSYCEIVSQKSFRFDRQCRIQINFLAYWPVPISLFGSNNLKLLIKASKIPFQKTVCFFHGADVAQPHLFDYSILKSSKEPFNSALCLRRVCVNHYYR